MNLAPLALCCSALFLVGCQSQITKPTTPSLNNESIVQVHSGSYFTFFHKGNSGPVNFKADNTSFMTYDKTDSSGAWLAKADSLCLSWTEFREGAERCFDVYDMGGDEYHYYINGEFSHKYTKKIVTQALSFMTKEELLNTIPGSTISGITDNSASWTQTYDSLISDEEQGKLTGKLGGDNYTANWSVKEGKWCENWGSGKDCWNMVLVDDTHLRLFKNGKPRKNLWVIK